VFAAMLVVATGCTGIETGNPVVPPTLDGERTELVEAGGGQLRLVGEPGAVTPATASVRFIDLQGASDYFDVPVAADGSFDLTFTGDSGHWFRGEATLAIERSAPVDEKVLSIMVPRPCLSIDPGELVVLEDAEPGMPTDVDLAVSNTCPDPIVVDAVLRIGAPDVTVMTASPFMLDPAAGATVVIQVVPSATLTEGIVVLTTDLGELRAVTIRARAP
jgi:hypothetical protein